MILAFPLRALCASGTRLARTGPMRPVTLKQGITTTDTSEAIIKAVAIEHSFSSFVLADSSKFGKVSAVTAAPVDSACIICDKCPDESIKSKTIVKEVKS